NKARLAELAQSHPHIKPLLADLTDVTLVSQVQHQLQDMPPVMGLVNLAGASIGNTIDLLEEDDWQQSFAINVTPAMRLIQAVSPMLRQQQCGSIVNVGSPVGLIGARKPSYAASKSALLGLTMSCARNFGADNIRVNLLLPGPTITEMTKDWSEERCQQIAQGSFFKRLCTPIEVAEVIAFLLSPASRYMTGSIVDMTAGSMWGH
ncbi:MAG: SDR family oxidoreductase, partial [Pseudomonadales bacterium]|nr:SDR family oxidoreductase [Pseudomonadales bacterium]